MAVRDRSIARLVISAGLLAASPVLAQPGGDPAAGRGIATDRCSNCHLIGPQAAPVAQDAAPHGPMPDYNLTPRQREDVVAYLLGLRP